MAVGPDDRRSGPYTLSAGQTGPHSFDFKITAASELRVTRRRSGAEGVLTLSVDYTVSVFSYPGTGTITLLEAPLDGDVLVIDGARNVQRPTPDFAANNLSETQFNTEADTKIRDLQELRRDIGDVMRGPRGAGGFALADPSVRASRVLGFDAEGNVTYLATTVAPGMDTKVVGSIALMTALTAGDYSSVMVETGFGNLVYTWSGADHSASGTGLVVPGWQKGVYVPPDSDTTGASGAYVLQFGRDIRGEVFGFDASKILQDVSQEWNNLQKFLRKLTPQRGVRIILPPYNFNMDSRPDPVRADNVEIIGAGGPYGCVLRRNYSSLTGMKGAGTPEAFIEVQAKTKLRNIFLKPEQGAGGAALAIVKNNDRFTVTGVARDGTSNNVLLTVAGHSYFDRQKVDISTFTDGPTDLNGNAYFIVWKDANTIELAENAATGADTSAITITGYTSGGQVDGAASGGDYSKLDVAVSVGTSGSFEFDVYYHGGYFNNNHNSGVAPGVRDQFLEGTCSGATDAAIFADGLIGFDASRLGVFSTSGDAIRCGSVGDAAECRNAVWTVSAINLAGGLEIDYLDDAQILAPQCAGVINIGANCTHVRGRISDRGTSTVTINGAAVDCVFEVNGVTYTSDEMLFDAGAGTSEHVVIDSGAVALVPVLPGLHLHSNGSSGSNTVGAFSSAGSTNLQFGVTNSGLFNEDVLRVEFDDVVNIPTGKLEMSGQPVVQNNGVMIPGDFTVATVPSVVEGGVIFVTNGDAGAPCLAVGNSGSWKRVALGAAVAAS